MQFKSRSRPVKSFLDITPVVDMVFNLLIFFAVSLSFITTSAIGVDLPKANTNEMNRQQKDLRLTVTHENRVFLNGNEVRTPEALLQSFRAAMNQQDIAQVFIEADETVPHGKVVAIMDLANGAGLKQVAIVTQLRDAKAGIPPSF